MQRQDETFHSWPLVHPDDPAQLTPWFTLMTFTIDPWFALNTLHSWPLVHPDDPHSSAWWPFTVDPGFTLMTFTVDPRFALMTLHNWPLVHPDDLHNWPCFSLMTIHSWPVIGYQESVHRFSSSPVGKLDWGSSLQQPPWFGRFPRCVTSFYSWLCFRHEHNPYGERIWGRAGGTVACWNRRYGNGMCATSLDRVPDALVFARTVAGA